MTKQGKCLKCNERLYRSYIRLNPNGKENRKWTPIGFYCIKCKKNFTEKELIHNNRKSKKNKQK